MGINLGEICLCTLQFVDDQVFKSNDKNDVECIVRKLQKKYRPQSQEINIKKTKSFSISLGASNLQLDNNNTITFTNKYTYLGVTLDTTKEDEIELNKRQVQARKTITGCLNKSCGRKNREKIYDMLIKSSLFMGLKRGVRNISLWQNLQ